jgi:hypothetical protein
MKKLLLLLCLAAAGLGCDHEAAPGGACPAIAQAGLDVGVAIDQTAEAVCDAAVTATDGSYAERLITTSCRYVGAFERPGTYVLRVEAPGFLTKEVSDVRVIRGAGQCPHVQAARLDIQLSRAAGPAAASDTPSALSGTSACVGTVAEYCALLGGRCPTFDESVARKRGLCRHPGTWLVATSQCAGVYRSVSWRDQMLGGGEEYFGPRGGLIGAHLYTDYWAYCDGRSFSQTFGVIPTCARSPSTKSVCHSLPPLRR